MPPPPSLPTLFNHCNLSPWAISSWEFQDAPRPLELGHIHAADRRLWTRLDLLYTFCQDELARRHPGQRWLTLYRGTHDPDEYALSDTPARDGRLLVALNNLSSFTSDREVAWEFGSSVWEVAVPLPKIIFSAAFSPPPSSREKPSTSSSAANTMSALSAPDAPDAEAPSVFVLNYNQPASP